jgi:hypothetical protein
MIYKCFALQLLSDTNENDRHATRNTVNIPINAISLNVMHIFR